MEPWPLILGGAVVLGAASFAGGVVWYEAKERLGRRKAEETLSAYVQATPTSSVDDAFAEGERMVIEEMLRGQKPNKGNVSAVDPTDDYITEVDVDPLGLGKPEPVKLKVRDVVTQSSKRKKRRK